MSLLLPVVTLPIFQKIYTQIGKICSLAVIKISEIYILYLVPFQCHQPTSQNAFFGEWATWWEGKFNVTSNQIFYQFFYQIFYIIYKYILLKYFILKIYCTHIFLLFLSPSFVICTPQNIRANSSCLCPARQKKTSKKFKKEKWATSSWFCPSRQQKTKKTSKKEKKKREEQTQVVSSQATETNTASDL